MNRVFASRLLMLAVLAALLPVASLSSSPARSNPSTEVGDQLDALFSRWRHPDTPGCAVGAQRRNESSVFRAYGSADLEHGVAIDDTTVFEAGSVSKQFTAASVVILIEQGKLRPDDDIRKYIPELPDYGVAITIAQLLGHTSGLRDWEGIVDIAGWPVTTRQYTVKDVLEIAARQKHLNYRPGTAFSYTNTGYVLLATIVERVSGEPFAEFGKERLFEPLGMHSTRWRDDFHAVVKGRAMAYDAVGDSYRQLMPFESVVGAGGLLTTVGDLLKWNDALDSGQLGTFVTSALQRIGTLSNGQPTSYAGGINVDDFHGVRRLWHSGETAGYEAYLARFPDQKVSIALLCNAGQAADVDSTGDKVASLFLDTPRAAPPARKAVSVRKTSPELLAPYAGTYFDAALALKSDMVVKDGVLQRVADGMHLTPLSPGTFAAPGSTIRFSGLDRFVREFDDGRRLEFQRTQPWHPSEADLIPFVGRYWSEEASTTYDVTIVNGRLTIATADRHWNTSALEPVSVDMFMKPHHAYRFLRDGAGAVSGLDVSEGWEHVYDLSFSRVAGIEH